MKTPKSRLTHLGPLVPQSAQVKFSGLFNIKPNIFSYAFSEIF